MPQGGVLGPLLFILYISKIFELVENRLNANTDDSTLLEVVHKPVYWPSDTASLNRDSARIRPGTWYWILTKLRLLSLADPGLSTLPMVTWSCLGFLSELVPTSTSLVCKLTFEDNVCGSAYSVSQRIGILRLMKLIFVDKSVYFIAILHLFSQSFNIVLQCGGQLLNVTISFLSTRICPDQRFLSLCYWRNVAGSSML